jgi:adenosylcobinamide-GDP ribazoletransferase
VRRALSFLTVLGRAAEPDARTLSWFPLVGLVVGAIVGGAWWAAGKAWAAPVAAVVAVAVDAAVTGCLHLDGLADAADGLLPPVDRSRRLEIMADPRVGAFGAVALVLVLGLRTAALASVTAAPLMIVALWCGSRTLMGVAARVLPSAHAAGGTAASFTGDPASPAQWAPSAALGTCAAVVAAVFASGAHGLADLGAELLGAGAVLWLALRRLGGTTGDVLGAAGVVGETIGLLALAAR